MDKDFSTSSVGIQYIICECGDNFPNENLLNIHIANGHSDVETFLCDVCSAVFTDHNLLLKHQLAHKKETPKKGELRTYSRKTPTENKEKMEKKPPVIKLQNLKRIDSISLIQKLKTYGRFIKIEPPAEPPAEQPAVPPAPPVQPVQSQLKENIPVVVKTEVVMKNEIVTEEDEEIYYQCDVCNSIFYTEAEFEVHYQSTHAMKAEPTPEEILEEHLVTDHGHQVQNEETSYYYECEICHKIFANEKYFNIHYNKAHGGLLAVVEPAAEHHTQNEEAPQPEPEPEAEAPAEDVKHKAPEQVIYYKCDLCKILYPSEKAYNLHFDKKHGGQSCTEIQTTGFQFIEQELTEEYQCEEVSVEVFACEYCPKTFTMKRSLQVHRKRVHYEQVRAREQEAGPPRAANRSKVCDVCGRAYNSNAALRYHQRRHTGEKPYPCTLCPKRFTMPMFLQIHMRTHTGEKPYECPHCPKAFTNKAALIRHDRVHTGVKPYPCPECGKYFTQSNSMKLHVSTVHLKLPAPYKSKSRRSKSEARALQLALKNLPADEDGQLVLGA